MNLRATSVFCQATRRGEYVLRQEFHPHALVHQAAPYALSCRRCNEELAYPAKKPDAESMYSPSRVLSPLMRNPVEEVIKH